MSLTPSWQDWRCIIHCNKILFHPVVRAKGASRACRSSFHWLRYSIRCYCHPIKDFIHFKWFRPCDRNIPSRFAYWWSCSSVVCGIMLESVDDINGMDWLLLACDDWRICIRARLLFPCIEYSLFEYFPILLGNDQLRVAGANRLSAVWLQNDE